MSFKAGDVVTLKSGGPKMTVKFIIGDGTASNDQNSFHKFQGGKDGDVVCEWFAGDVLKSASFKPDLIEIA